MKNTLVLLLISAGSALAGSIFVTFDPLADVPPGGMVTITGTLMNSTPDTIFINGDSFTMTSPLTLDDSPFLANAPLSLDGGVTSADFAFATVTVPGGTAAGGYDGVFDVLGGADANAQEVLGAGQFTTQVAAVPEPSAAWLALPALGLIFAFRRLRFARG